MAVFDNVTIIAGETTSPDIPMIDSIYNSSRGGIDGFYLVLRELTIVDDVDSTSSSSDNRYLPVV